MDWALDISFVVEAIKTTLGIPAAGGSPAPLVSPFLTVDISGDTDTSDLNYIHRGDWESCLPPNLDSWTFPALIIDPCIDQTPMMERGRGLGGVKSPAYEYIFNLYYIMEKEDADETTVDPIRNPYLVAHTRADAIRAKLNADRRLGTLGGTKQIAMSEIGPPTFNNPMHDIVKKSDAGLVVAQLPFRFWLVENEVA